jgi:hypothetical protein
MSRTKSHEVVLQLDELRVQFLPVFLSFDGGRRRIVVQSLVFPPQLLDLALEPPVLGLDRLIHPFRSG